jgi:hypothetical protein
MAATLFALALPAVAQAGSGWQRVADPAPGGTDDYRFPPRVALGVAAGTPYVASLSRDRRLTVSRPDRGSTGWRQIGGPLNHDPAQPASSPNVTASGSTVWVTWVERDAQGAYQVRLARLAGGTFREVVGGASPINEPGDSAGYPYVTVFGGRPYVAYVGHASTVRVARLRPSGRSFEQLDAGLDVPNASTPQLLVLGSRLHVAYATYAPDTGNVQEELARLNERRSRWEGVALPAYLGSPLDIAFASGTPYRTFGGGQNAPDAPRDLVIEAFRSGAWQPIPSPGTPGDDVNSQQVVGSGGVLWVIWDAAPGGPFATPRLVHVARLGVRR